MDIWNSICTFLVGLITFGIISIILFGVIKLVRDAFTIQILPLLDKLSKLNILKLLREIFVCIMTVILLGGCAWSIYLILRELGMLVCQVTEWCGL